MIASITTSTITTISSMVNPGLVAALSLVVVLCWLGLLSTRVLASSSGSGPAQRVATFLNVGILPLTIVFLVILAVKTAAILS